MPFPQLGKVRILDARDLWKNEECDFTPWLTANIDQISAVLGIPIVVDQTEHKVGAYELDILGHVGETDAVVILENQLDQTDHSHLGQLIAYAAGLEATIVVWVVPDVRDEHKAAIKWLNSHSDEKVSYFLVRPEVFRIDDSPPAVRFYVEAAPSEFSRRLRRVVEEEDAPRHEFRRRFWEDLLQYLAANGHQWAEGRGTTKDNVIESTVGRSGVGVNVSMAHGSRMRVEIYCSRDPEKQQFQQLSSHKQDIESHFPGEAVSWEPLEDATASRVAVYKDYDKQQASDDTPHRRELFVWIGKHIGAFRTIAKQYLVDRQHA